VVVRFTWSEGDRSVGIHNRARRSSPADSTRGGPGRGDEQVCDAESRRTCFVDDAVLSDVAVDAAQIVPKEHSDPAAAGLLLRPIRLLESS
jgi:hypothetical protein